MERDNLINIQEAIPMENLIYWIDKEFVQDRANYLFGKELSDDELIQTKKYIESGLAYSVFDIIDIALKQAIS